MRVRRLHDEHAGTTRQRRVVWFGSYGTNSDGTAKFVNINNKHDNFATEQTMIKDSLIQRLSVIQHELWYDARYGMPLVDADSAQILIDAFVMQTIRNHPHVLAITKFNSHLEKTKYVCNVEFSTEFGNVVIIL